MNLRNKHDDTKGLRGAICAKDADADQCTTNVKLDFSPSVDYSVEQQVLVLSTSMAPRSRENQNDGTLFQSGFAEVLRPKIKAAIFPCVSHPLLDRGQN